MLLYPVEIGDHPVPLAVRRSPAGQRGVAFCRRCTWFTPKRHGLVHRISAKATQLWKLVAQNNSICRPFLWARLGSNQRPLACEASALPLSYAPGTAPVYASRVGRHAPEERGSCRRPSRPGSSGSPPGLGPRPTVDGQGSSGSGVGGASEPDVAPLDGKHLANCPTDDLSEPNGLFPTSQLGNYPIDLFGVSNGLLPRSIGRPGPPGDPHRSPDGAIRASKHTGNVHRGKRTQRS